MPAAPDAAMAINAGKRDESPVFAEAKLLPPVTLVTFAEEDDPDLFAAGNDDGVVFPSLSVVCASAFFHRAFKVIFSLTGEDKS